MSKLAIYGDLLAITFAHNCSVWSLKPKVKKLITVDHGDSKIDHVSLTSDPNFNLITASNHDDKVRLKSR